VAAVGDGQALDLMKPLNASVADSKLANMSRVGEAWNQEGYGSPAARSLPDGGRADAGASCGTTPPRRSTGRKLPDRSDSSPFHQHRRPKFGHDKTGALKDTLTRHAELLIAKIYSGGPRTRR
jgi:hypothetical protein